MKDVYQFNLGHWFFSFYTRISVWGLKCHWNEVCCKFWLLVGPFEINRVYTDADFDAKAENHEEV